MDTLFHQVLFVCSFQAQLDWLLSEEGETELRGKSRAASGRKATAVGMIQNEAAGVWRQPNTTAHFSSRAVGP